ncbi:MAG TPA: isochorismatase family cysteine hydrolase, partial [Steroidobacteraceae bacterium]|nr:isochorismatase family cysteine hydrolase [Steroidobacteraceae bacterium]
MVASSNDRRSLHGAAPDRSSVALLVLDMVSDFAFEDGATVSRAALPIARRIARLAERARKARVPVVFVNDNLGRWRSDFSAIVRHCSRAASRGAPILEILAPQPGDYAVLKPKHSGFYATPLATLLEYLGARQLVLTGVSTHQCVLFTANDAYVRDYRLRIPRDCVAARSRAETRLAARYFRSVLDADMAVSSKVVFRGATPRKVKKRQPRRP